MQVSFDTKQTDKKGAAQAAAKLKSSMLRAQLSLSSGACNWLWSQVCCQETEA